MALFQPHDSYDAVIGRVGLALYAEGDGIADAMGSATLIGGNLAITARHVIEDYWKKFHPDYFKQFTGFNVDGHAQSHDSLFQALAFQFIKIGEQCQMIAWVVVKIALVKESDIAILLMRPMYPLPNGYEWARPKIDPLLPPVGSIVSAFGYYDGKVEIDATARQISHKSATSAGTVVEVYPDGHGTRKPWPCFQVNTFFEGGMSGGPAFDDDGSLCGIVIDGFSKATDGAEDVAFVAGLFPLLTGVVDFDREDLPKGTSYTMWDLAQKGVIDAKMDRVLIKFNQDNRPHAIGMQGGLTRPPLERPMAIHASGAPPGQSSWRAERRTADK